MRRHDAYVGLIRSTVVVFAIGFAWSWFALADEPTSPPAPSDQSVQERAVPRTGVTGPLPGTLALPDGYQAPTTDPTMDPSAKSLQPDLKSARRNSYQRIFGMENVTTRSTTSPTQQNNQASPTVSLTQAVHFMDAKGQDLMVGPGEFRVEAAGKSGLKLTPADGKEPIIIEGQVGSVKAPVALSVPVNENEHHLVLLLPKGKVVEVVGSPSGIRSREVALTVIASPTPIKSRTDPYRNFKFR